jgi:diguanylate cyclase (GGDEF)-like protein
MARSSPGLRVRLMQLVLLAVVPAFGVIGYNALVEYEHAAEDAERDAARLAQLAAREHTRLITQTRHLLINLSQLPPVQAQRPLGDCRRVLVEAQISHPLYTNIGVARLDGDVICNSRRLRERVNIADRDYFRGALALREFASGTYQIGRVTGAPAINFGYPVFDREGEITGVIYAALDLRWLTRLIADVDPPMGSEIFVTDNGGAILAHYPEADAWIGESKRETPIVAAVLGVRQSGTADVPGLDGVPRLHAYAPLSVDADKDADAYIVVGVARSAAFAEANRQFARNLELLLVAAALALIAAWVGSRVFVLRRMSALTEAARRLGHGDYSTRTGLLHGSDEFGQLAQNFDRMAETLQRVNRALKTLSAGNRTMVRATDEQSLLNDMCRVVVENGGYRMAWIGYAEHDEAKSIRPVAEYGFIGGMAGLSKMVEGINWDDRERGRGALGTSIRTRQPSVQRDFANNPNLVPWREEALKRGFGSVASFPLLIDQQPIGALAIYAPEIDAFDTEELELLEESASDLAFGIAGLRIRAESERAQATIQHLSRYDRLTGLPNHAQYQEHLRHALPPAGTGAPPLAVAMIGLNRFREINEALGFQQGDALLHDVGARLRAAVVDDIVVARMRGDEFGLLIVDNDEIHVGKLVRQVLASLQAPIPAGELQLEITAAVGIAMFPQHGADAMQLLRCADVAMQQAKKTNKDYVFYAAGHDANSARRLSLAGELRHAIEHGELVLHYQGKIDVPSGRVCGAEALVRWMHPTRGMVRPDEFITLAEQTGLIRPLTEWVLSDALRQSAAWRQRGVALPIAVNLSPRNLHDAELVYKLDQLLAAVRADVDWLEVEITEGAVMEDPDGALSILARLNEMGILLYIDDFGTGYSSLGYLKKLPVDAVKIDKSFVIDMLNSTDSAAIVRSTIDLAHDLDLKVVAEGVEQEAILEKLSVLGCDVAQGYYFSKPLPADLFREWVAARTQPAARSGRRAR